MKREVKDFDRFSDLPEPIVHHVMSFLPPTSATRMSALSKNFNSAWRSYPIFDFDQNLYQPQQNDFDLSGDRTSFKPPEFLNYVCDSLKRCPSNISMQRFSLRVWLPPGRAGKIKSDDRVEESIGFAVDRNVKELVLEIDQTKKFCYYRLPPTTLQYAKSLNVLKLSGFSFEFEDLIPSCNFVEDLSLEKCRLSGNFVISSAKLTSLKINFCIGLEKIKIDALNLESFTYIVEKESPCEINLSHCKNLKSLTLERSTITDNWLKQDVSKNVHLRHLKLVSCKKLKKIKISNQELKSLELLQCDELLKAKIDAPRLISFHYSGDLEIRSPNINLLCSTLAHAKISLTTTYYTNYSTYSGNLTTFLCRFGHCKTLSLCCDYPRPDPESKPEKVFHLDII